MTTLLHISDLHFGRVDMALVENLLNEIAAKKPDLVVVSGDFTQEALKSEFRAAQNFMNRIPAPVFTVPGNHDIPRYNPYQRLFDPLRRYREFINSDIDPTLQLADTTLVGLNTARPFVPHWNWAHGMVSKRQIAATAQQFAAVPTGHCRVLVCHHPLIVAQGAPMDTIVWGGKDLLNMLAQQNVDLVLTGHIHHASVTIAKNDKQLIAIGAGTATSTRLRKQTNGYNLIRIEPHYIEIDLIHRIDRNFALLQTHHIDRYRYKQVSGKA